MRFKSVTFLCDALRCQERFTKTVHTGDDDVTVYLALVDAGWQVTNSYNEGRKHYCPDDRPDGQSRIRPAAPSEANNCGVGGPREASSDCVRQEDHLGEHRDASGGTWPWAEAPRFRPAVPSEGGES